MMRLFIDIVCVWIALNSLIALWRTKAVRSGARRKTHVSGYGVLPRRFTV